MNDEHDEVTERIRELLEGGCSCGGPMTVETFDNPLLAVIVTESQAGGLSLAVDGSVDVEEIPQRLREIATYLEAHTLQVRARRAGLN